MKLTPVGKEYMCFHIDGKPTQAAKCIQSRLRTMLIYYVLSIDTFEPKCVVIKYMLQSTRVNDHMKTIGIDQSLSNNDLFEHRCLKNINKLYQHAGQCDGQQKSKDIIAAAMVSNNEGFADNSTRSPMTPIEVKKPSARKSMCIFTNILHMKNKTDIRQVRATKSNLKTFKSETTLWAKKKKSK